MACNRNNWCGCFGLGRCGNSGRCSCGCGSTGNNGGCGSTGSNSSCGCTNAGNGCVSWWTQREREIYENGREAGRREGYADGYRFGYQEGYQIGYQEGYRAGYRAAGGSGCSYSTSCDGCLETLR